jgi:hypothetical protein
MFMGHRLSHTHLYSVWENMKGTCKKTGMVYEIEWSIFLLFKEWAEKIGYKEGK